jgi:putative flippase GtrA
MTGTPTTHAPDTGSLRLMNVRRLWQEVEHLVAELVKFGTVGGLAAIVDVGLSNLLRFGIGLGPLTAKTLAVTIAATLTFLGNRFWTWRHRARQHLAKEYVLYFGLNAVGLLVALVPVGVTHYLLRLDGPLAYNISANVVGLGLGSLFRFWAYRRWVFLPTEPAPSGQGTAAAVTDPVEPVVAAPDAARAPRLDLSD